MHKLFLLFVNLLLISFNAVAQRPNSPVSSQRSGASPSTAQRVTVSGFVTDAGSGERMIDATVYERATFAGTTTNSYGFYSLPLQPGEAEIIVSYLGYDPDTVKISLTRDTIMNFTRGNVIQRDSCRDSHLLGPQGEDRKHPDEHDRYTDRKISQTAGHLR